MKDVDSHIEKRHCDHCGKTIESDPRKATTRHNVAAHYTYELRRYEASFRAGSFPALYEALHICRENRLPVPEWAVDGAIMAMEILSPFNRSRKRGRAGNPFARYRQNFIHADRYYAVVELRERQEEAWEALKHLKKLVPGTRAVDYARQYCERVGKTWEDAYQIASDELRGTAARGTPATIKSSYRHVKALQRVPGASPRFMFVRTETLRRLGFRDLHGSSEPGEITT